MLEFIIQGQRMVFLFAFPLIGLIFDVYIINQKIIKYLKYTTVILLLPLLFNFKFRIDYLDFILILILLSSFYSDYSKKLSEERKGGRAYFWAFLLLLLLGTWWCFSNMLVITKTEEIYTLDSYHVYDHSDRGFSGGTAHNYELSQNALIPLYEKSIQTTRKTDSCYIYFTSKITFDKCNSKLIFDSTKNEDKPM